jgi:hypothetical protein
MGLIMSSAYKARPNRVRFGDRSLTTWEVVRLADGAVVDSWDEANTPDAMLRAEQAASQLNLKARTTTAS